MKKTLYSTATLLALLVSITGFAKNTHKKDPEFRHSFHHAKNVHRFDKENGFTEYDFMLKGNYVSAFYDPSGNLIETDFSIAYKELPERAKAFINTELPTAILTDITRVQYKQSTCYKVRLESGTKEYALAVTSTGEITLGCD